MIALQERPGRTVFVTDHQCEWGTKPLLGKAAADWRRRRSTRESAVLTFLAQHTYATTRDLYDLFWPDQPLQSTQKVLRRVMDRGLVMRWWQLIPRTDGWRRRSCVWLLTRAGATLVADELGWELKPLVQRSFYAAEGAGSPEHDLEAVRFFTALAVAAAQRPNCGLYSWIGEPGMRRQIAAEHELGITAASGNLAPDGWGLLLIPGGGVTLHLEVDQGTEPTSQLALKASRYLQHARRREQVLFVLPSPGRERSVRASLQRVTSARDREVGLWTTTRERLEEHGSLGAVWAAVSAEEIHRSVLDLPASPVPEDLEVEHSIGKPHWWVHRPGGGEGA